MTTPGRTLLILLLVAAGFCWGYAATEDPLWFAVGCWALAGVYGYLTAPRRGL